MAVPFIVISTFKVKPGRAEELKEYIARTYALFEAEEPRVIAFHAFINEDETEYSNIQVHPDSASMDFHMQVLRDNWDEMFSRYGDNVEGVRVDCYGDTPPSVLEQEVEGGPVWTFKPHHLGGFTRP